MIEIDLIMYLGNVISSQWPSWKNRSKAPWSPLQPRFSGDLGADSKTAQTLLRFVDH